MVQPKVLIIDEDQTTIRELTVALQDECVLLTTSEPTMALRLAREHDPQLILLDLDLPPTSSVAETGIRLLQDLRKYGIQAKIICTGYGGREGARRAVNCGVHDFITKPVALDLLTSLVRRACWLADVERERHVLPKEDVEEMIGTSENIRRIFDAIRKVATTDVPVLMTGESGTGKELTAKAIHERSVRKQGPFAAINCGAIPDNLLESELFGHERGAFTGAVHQKKGKVEYAQGGTLFLDEVAELPYALQVKLLRFLQECTFERVGGRQSIEMDVRIMAATNVNLKQAIECGAFREDLYYRLGVVHIHLPPLRDRGEDTLLMAAVFLKQAGEQQGKRLHGFTQEAIQAIQAYGWPGNVRELSNKIRRAVVMAEHPHITPEDLDLPFDRQAMPHAPSLKDARLKIEVDLIAQAVTLHAGNLSRVAEELGISRPTLYRRLRRYGLFKAADAVKIHDTTIFPLRGTPDVPVRSWKPSFRSPKATMDYSEQRVMKRRRVS